MLPFLIIMVLLLFFVVPAAILAYFYFSKYYSCPFCGEKILKSETKCTSCKSELQKPEKYDQKALSVAKAYRDGGKQFLYDGEKPEEFEKEFKK